MSGTVTEDVKEYYGKKLAGTKDLVTNVCTLGTSTMPKHVRDALKLVHDEVTSKYYGCGLVVPECLEGASVLDLGSGSGQDCYVLSKLVGEKGYITGIDMTEEQLETANKYIQHHTEKFGYSQPNINFVKGYIEKLGEAGLKDDTFDIIVSNCVVNLSADKKAVLKEAHRVLKEGGEFYFSDIYADRDLPDEVRKHKVLWGECISGALWWEDLAKIASEVGLSQPRLVTANKFKVGNRELEELLGEAQFMSVTYRLFKLPAEKQKPCQVIYNGEIEGHEKEIKLDFCNTFKTEDVCSVDSDVATILKSSRFAKEFEFQPASQTGVSGGCCPQTKEDLVDPFKYWDQYGSSSSGGCGQAASSGCCSSVKPEATTGGSCCPAEKSSCCQ